MKLSNSRWRKQSRTNVQTHSKEVKRLCKGFGFTAGMLKGSLLKAEKLKMFSLDQYKKVIFELIDNGLTPTIEWSGIPTKNTLLIRHDIDFSVDFAYKLALFESELEIRSTYFLMLTSNMYNLLSSENQRLVRSIIKLGHKVSIHFDPTAHENLEDFEHEKDCLKTFLMSKLTLCQYIAQVLF